MCTVWCNQIGTLWNLMSSLPNFYVVITELWAPNRKWNPWSIIKTNMSAVDSFDIAIQSLIHMRKCVLGSTVDYRLTLQVTYVKIGISISSDRNILQWLTLDTLLDPSTCSTCIRLSRPWINQLKIVTLRSIK